MSTSAIIARELPVVRAVVGISEVDPVTNGNGCCVFCCKSKRVQLAIDTAFSCFCSLFDDKLTLIETGKFGHISTVFELYRLESSVTILTVRVTATLHSGLAGF